MGNPWLMAAGGLNAVASLVHLGCIVGGAPWYRFFGAGEGMARLAERGSMKPTLITLCIAGILALWSICAFSGAGILPRLPLLKPALIAITVVYLLRAAALPLMLRTVPDLGWTFLFVSSAIVLAIGLIHAIGLWTGWRTL
ncbi:MAG TPA: hypothetical protein VF633_10730 [Brevundimonas sp.]|jgi:hypothetical protein